MRSTQLTRVSLSLMLFVATLFVLAACGGSAAPAASSGGAQVIKIGSLHPLTGPFAGDGKQMDTAAQMAVDSINAAGGIKALGGAKLQIDSGDTQGVPNVATNEAQRLIGDKDVALIGTYQSDVTQEVARTAQRAQVPLVIDVTAADDILNQGYTYVFRIQPNASNIGTHGADYLKQISSAAGKPVKTIAYIHESSDFGTSVFKAFKAEAEKDGMQVVKEITYDVTKVTDLTSAVTQVKQANPDILAVTGYYQDGLLLAKNAAAVTPSVKAVFGVADGAFDLPQFPGDAGKAGAYYFNTNYHFSDQNGTVRKLRADFKARTGQDMRTPAVFSYQAVLVIAAALERAKSSDASALRDALAQTSLSSELFPFSGPIQFNSKGENINAQPIVMQVQNNAVMQIYPQAYAEARPIFPATPWSGGSH